MHNGAKIWKKIVKKMEKYEEKTDRDISKIRIDHPIDMHVHFRSGSLLKSIAPYTARQFWGAVVMPNTPIPITTTQRARAYRREIMGALPDNTTFRPLVMAYLTDATDPDDLAMGHQKNIFFGAKLYPRNATTNSALGVSNIYAIDSVLKVMQQLDMPLSIHGEVADNDVDVFEREKVFIDTVLCHILATYPDLRVTLEHITTIDAVNFLKTAGNKLAATITPQHLLYTRNALLAGNIRPHLYCLPILKHEDNRLALIDLATSGFKRVFLGTDSAPHVQRNKESARGCAGIFSAMNALEIYAYIFDKHGAINTFESFAAHNACAFHRLDIPKKRLCLTRTDTAIPAYLTMQNGQRIVPLKAAENVPWRVVYDD